MSRIYLLRRKKQAAALGTATAVQMNTTLTNTMGADGFTWANAPALVDANGNLIAITMDNSQVHRFTYKNTGGNWTDSSLNEPFLVRGGR